MDFTEFKTIFSASSLPICWQEPLDAHTSFRVGGKAWAYVEPQDRKTLKQLFKETCQHHVAYLILGDGSNVLIPDVGFHGIVFNLRHFQELNILSTSDSEILVFVGAGLRKQKLLTWAIEKGISGLEFLSGVPGQIGGGIIMNAGTSYGSFQDVVTKIFMITSQGIEEEVLVSSSHFSYRKQTFSQNKIITGAILKLKSGDPHEISRRVKWMVDDRKAKQPLQHPNCGSTFLNPLGGMPAGKLIETAGLKGFRKGGAMISDKHANFIVNLGGATAQDILFLIETAEKKVKEVHGISLEREVIIVKNEA